MSNSKNQNDPAVDILVDELMDRNIPAPEPDTSIYTDSFDPAPGSEDLDKALGSTEEKLC